MTAKITNLHTQIHISTKKDYKSERSTLKVRELFGSGSEFRVMLLAKRRPGYVQSRTISLPHDHRLLFSFITSDLELLARSPVTLFLVCV
jgi:hypothetical protein